MRRIGNRVECGRRSSTKATRADDTARTCRRHGGRDRIRAQREVGDERVVLRADGERERITRAAEIAEVTGQIEMMSTFVQQSNELLRNRIVRPDSSIAADNYKMTIVTDDDVPENNKNVT